MRGGAGRSEVQDHLGLNIALKANLDYTGNPVSRGGGRKGRKKTLEREREGGREGGGEERKKTLDWIKPTNI